MERTNLRNLRDLLRIVAVMTGWMVRFRNADLWIRPIALLARELECDDARDIRLKGQNLQVEHKLRVVGERYKDAHRAIHVGRLVVHRHTLGTLDLTLDLTNTVDILIHPRTIRNADPLFELCDIHTERIQQTSAAVQRRTAFGRIATLAEQAFEHDPWMRLGRKRRRRRRP